MNRPAKSLLLVALLACGAVASFAVRDAFAGNFADPVGTKYWSVRLVPGQYIHTTAQPWRIILDDITYSVDYVPCPTTEVCEFIPWEEIPRDPGENTAGNYYWTGFGDWYETAFWQMVGTVARSEVYSVKVVDTNGTGDSEEVDAFTLSTYGEVLHKMVRELYGHMHFVGDPLYYGYAGGAGIGGVARTNALAFGLTSVPSSGSRHYQSPQFCKYGRFLITETSGHSSSAVVYLKGRGVPWVANDDMSIQIVSP